MGILCDWAASFPRRQALRRAQLADRALHLETIVVKRNGRCPRARWPRPLAPCLAGLPRHRNRRRLPDEPAVRRLARRTLFRLAARRLDRRSRDPSLGQSNPRGGAIVPSLCESAAITPGERPFRRLSRILRSGSADHRVSSAANPARCVISHGRRECASAVAVRQCDDLRRLALLLLRGTVRQFGPRRAGRDRRHGNPTALPFTAFVAEASQRFSIPANWIWRLCGSRAEEIRAPFRQRAQWG